MKTATFDNGIGTTYKGDRNVTHAWIIVNKEAPSVLVKKGYSVGAQQAFNSGRAAIEKPFHRLDKGARMFYAKRTGTDFFKAKRAMSEANSKCASNYSVLVVAINK